LPTTAECGLPEVLVSTVNPVALPAGAPAEVIDTIAVATRRIMADEKLQADLRGLAIEPVADADAARSAAYFSAERERWAPIIKAAAPGWSERLLVEHRPFGIGCRAPGRSA